MHQPSGTDLGASKFSLIYRFETPVFVRQAQSVEEIRDLAGALDLLERLPNDMRGLAYETVRDACVRATQGSFPFVAIRENFRKFLKRVEMLVEDESSLVSA